jgi:hypothetical protein
MAQVQEETVSEERIAQFKKITQEYFERYIESMKVELGDNFDRFISRSFNAMATQADDADTKRNKANARLLQSLVRYNTGRQPNAANIIPMIQFKVNPDLSVNAEAFEMKNTFMAVVNANPDLLDPVIVAKILLISNIQLLLEPRPPGITIEKYLESKMEYVPLQEDELTKFIEIMQSIKPPKMAKKKGGRKSKKNRKTKRRSKRNL